MPNREKLVSALLDRLEQEESRLLVWGVVDGNFTRDEVIAHAKAILDNEKQSNLSETDLAGILNDRVLLIQVYDNPPRFRTRMAETIRLMRRLRQWFPTNGNGDANDRSWESASTLVSDYRLSVVPRRYPIRSITEKELQDLLRQHDVAVSVESLSALKSLLTKPTPRLLAKFQAESTVSVLKDLSGDRTSALIVGAGTGTGKTLAFYLPALMYLSDKIQPTKSARVLAIYPRNELLKDQFATAYDEARRLDGVRKRPVTIGVWNSFTPKTINDLKWREIKSRSRSLGRICPYLACPRSNCDGSLIWLQTDIESQTHRLTCPNCAGQIKSEHVLLTREAMITNPPDILFTTTESLNRLMSSYKDGVIVGIGSDLPPRLVLLDEVHTYNTVLGAHVSYLLRRWRHAIGRKYPVAFVGLSATLRDSAEVFGQLVDVIPASVTSLQPIDADLAETTGNEYRIALRGDPFSATSLLSTTIQVCMLLRRTLDRVYQNQTGKSKGLYGRQVFVFTDTLDLVNRLESYLNNAERNGLAGLRRPSHEHDFAKDAAGQSWALVTKLGFTLLAPDDPNVEDMRLRIGRTSSQDQGVDPAADVIVASSSLEMGYDSPEVGAVIQHKAPRDGASFLQRIGRAGRPKDMRPWKVAVLSDYGRDRLAYNSHELLFDPQLRPGGLATRNRNVLRIQAAFAFIDWLALLARNTTLHNQYRSGSARNDLCQPPEASHTWVIERQKFYASIIEKILFGDFSKMKSFKDYLQGALKIDEEELQTILYEPPRSLIGSVLPTTLRRLRSSWTLAEGKTQDYFINNQPLPEFLPKALFNDLNLPEIIIQDHNNIELDQLGIADALRMLAPGNVTKRFAPFEANTHHWVEITQATVKLSSFIVSVEELAPVKYFEGNKLNVIRCLRPWKIKVKQTPNLVLPTSRGFLDWHSQLSPIATPPPILIFSGSPWSWIFVDGRFCTHRSGRPLRVRRFTPGGNAVVRSQKGNDNEIRYLFTDSENNPISIGFDLDTDAVIFSLRLPENIEKLIETNPGTLRGAHAEFFRYSIKSSEKLSGLANTFQRDRLADLLISALGVWAASENISMSAAHKRIEKQFPETLKRTLQIIFQSSILAAPQDDSDESPDLQKATARLLEIVEISDVKSEMLRLAPILWGIIPSEETNAWREWLQSTLIATLGNALTTACRGLCHEYDTGDLLMDFNQGPPIDGCAELPSDKIVQIIISESLPGGVGMIEALHTAYATDPGRFFSLFDAALAKTEFEVTDVQLSLVLQLSVENESIREALAKLRTAIGHTQLLEATKSLINKLTDCGVLMTHNVKMGLLGRIARPGTNYETDKLLFGLIQLWNAEEDKLGVELDARVFAFLASKKPDIREILLRTVGQYANPNDDGWAFSQILAMLWPRGAVTRRIDGDGYNPFSISLPTNIEIARILAKHQCQSSSVLDTDWLTNTLTSLATYGIADIFAPLINKEKLAVGLTKLLQSPVMYGSLRFFPIVDAVRFEAQSVYVRVRVKEIA